MCQGLTGPTIDGRDEWYLDNEIHREFIKTVQNIRSSGASAEESLRLIEPYFQTLLADPS